MSRVPVCPRCLNAPVPFAAEYLCSCCHTPFVNARPLDEEGRCVLCRRGLSGFDSAYAFGSYEGTLRKLIQLFKYGRIQTLAQPLGRLLAAAVPRERSFDVIVPMPMHWRRRWSRGFNQAELLARVLARRLNLRVVKPVRRLKATAPQAGLTAAARRQNMSGVFQVRKAGQVRGKRILLVDDVFTTGATAAACARALKRAGAVSVAVLTVARTDRRLAGTGSAQVHFERTGRGLRNEEQDGDAVPVSAESHPLRRNSSMRCGRPSPGPQSGCARTPPAGQVFSEVASGDIPPGNLSFGRVH